MNVQIEVLLIGVFVGVLTKIVYDWLRGLARYNGFEQRFVTIREFEIFKEQMLKRLDSIERKLDNIIMLRGIDNNENT